MSPEISYVDNGVFKFKRVSLRDFDFLKTHLNPRLVMICLIASEVPGIYGRESIGGNEEPITGGRDKISFWF